MWIIPKTLSAYAPDMVDWMKESEWAQNCKAVELEKSLMWRSKFSQCRTWWQRWKRVPYLRFLFGRILKPSMQSHFEDWYRESLAATHASRSQWQGSGRELKTHDTFGRIYERLLTQLDLFGASSKTSQATSAWDMTKFTEAYEIWVTELRQDSLRRRKLAHHISGKGSSSWPTASTSDAEGGHFGDQVEFTGTSFRKVNMNGTAYGAKLRDAVEHQQNCLTPTAQVNWATPNTMDSLPPKTGEALERNKKKGGCRNLREDVNNPTMNWPTPTSAEGGKIGNNPNYGQVALGNHPAIVGLPNRAKATKGDASAGGHHAQENHNTSGNTQEQPLKKKLNPLWVCQLMGLDFEKTFYVHLVME